MAKYHETGTICKATVKACPLGIEAHIEAASDAEFESALKDKLTEEGRFLPQLKKTSKEYDSLWAKEVEEDMPDALVDYYNGGKVWSVLETGRFTTSAMDSMLDGYLESGVLRRKADGTLEKA
jgi:hypothetical protein